VRRAGAYQETLLGIERVRAAGLEVGCNIFLTRENLAQFDALVADLLARGVTQFWVGPANYLPTARSRRYEALRPALADLVPLVEPVQALPGPCFEWAVWADLAAHTEAAYVQRALDRAWPAEPEPGGEELQLVCRPNLDLHWRFPGAIAFALGTSVATMPRRCCGPHWRTGADPQTTRCGSRSTRSPTCAPSRGSTATLQAMECISPRSRCAIAGSTWRSGVHGPDSHG
jgi:hypothetical protein